MQNQCRTVPPPAHDGSISLPITLLICHFNGCSHCSHHVPCLCARGERVYGFVIICVRLIVGLLIQVSSAYVDCCVWLRTVPLVMKCQFIRRSPRRHELALARRYVRMCSAQLFPSVSNRHILLIVSLIISASSRCDGIAAN